MRDWFYLPNFETNPALIKAGMDFKSAESPIPDLNKRNMITR